MPLSSARKQQLDQAIQTAFTSGSIDLATPVDGACSDTITAATTTAAAYTPGTPADWNGAPPTSIAAALDRCAALLKTLNTGTGP